MTNPSVLLDTGPLVAFLNGRDYYHDWTVNVLNQTKFPLFTCDAVLSEACFLLRNFAAGPEKVMELMRRGLVISDFNISDQVDDVKILLRKYKKLPISFADACLIKMSELKKNSIVMTLDSDFKIYRKGRGNVIPTITP